MSLNAAPAYALWVQMATRVSTGSIHSRSGTEEAAAESIATLFPTIRELLEKHPEAAGFRAVAWDILENVLRPCTNRWHGWLIEDQSAIGREGAAGRRFREERLRRVFRQELRELQQALEPYLDRLAQLAGIANERQASSRQTASLGGAVRLGIQARQLEIKVKPGRRSPLATVDEINATELGAVYERRKLLGRTHKLDAPEVLDDNRHVAEPARVHDGIGLALSGGGIRSATFSLGIVQVLARRNLLLSFDFLSSVSGGGYLASFLSCALGTEVEKKPTSTNAKEAEARIKDTFERGESAESGLMRHLRNHSKFLLHGGFLGKVRIVGLMLSGLLWNLMIMLPVPVIAALLVVWAGPAYWGSEPLASEPWPSLDGSAAGLVLKWSAIFLASAWVAIPGFQLLAHGQPRKSKVALLCSVWENLCLGLGFVVAGAAVLYALPAVLVGYEWLRSTPLSEFARWIGVDSAHAGSTSAKDLLPASVAGVGSAALGTLSGWIAPHWPRLRALSVRLFILSGPLFLLMIFLMVANHLGLARPGAPIWDFTWIGGITLVLVLWNWWLVNINTFAPHRYYRNRICECYLARRPAEPAKENNWLMSKLHGERKQGRTEVLQQVRLSSLGADVAAPYHFVNMTVNAPTSDNKDLRGRGGDFFVASRHFYGSPITGYGRVRDLEKSDPHFDLGTAMAVSAGAAGGNMGWKTLPHFRFIMTVMNVRLGYWLRNPERPAGHRFFEGAGPWYLFRELLGWIDESSRYVNLSDGGHIENLAAYELLRRRCKYIICVDGGCEPGMECADLTRLQRYAAIDLGVEMSFDLDELMLGPKGYSRSQAILVKITYPAIPDPEGKSEPSPEETGWMIYLKLAMTGHEPAYVKDYQRDNPDFPHQTTGDQIFEEEQFEAYRALGECAMESLFAEELHGKALPKSVPDLFRNLASSLLPDNDPAFRESS